VHKFYCIGPGENLHDGLRPKTARQFSLLIAITIPVKKPIRIDPDPIFILKSDRDFNFYSGEIIQESLTLPGVRRTLMSSSHLHGSDEPFRLRPRCWGIPPLR
jgi:hypothetical protein